MISFIILRNSEPSTPTTKSPLRKKSGTFLIEIE